MTDVTKTVRFQGHKTYTPAEFAEALGVSDGDVKTITFDSGGEIQATVEYFEEAVVAAALEDLDVPPVPPVPVEPPVAPPALVETTVETQEG